MSTDYSILLEQYPEVVSKDQMYKICHTPATFQVVGVGGFGGCIYDK